MLQAMFHLALHGLAVGKSCGHDSTVDAGDGAYLDLGGVSTGVPTASGRQDTKRSKRQGDKRLIWAEDAE